MRILITFAWSLLSICHIIWVSMPGQGWMWWRKSRRRTALRQRRPVSSRCRRWWGGRGWNHNMCWNTIWGHAIVASCCINIISNIRYQFSALSVLSALSWSSEQTNVPSIAGDSCPFTCPKWRHRPFQSSSSSYFPQDCGELPVEWADFFAWRKSKTAL